MVRVGKEEEEEKLAGEITCLVWATALMALVYSCIREAKKLAQPDDIVNTTVFPQVRFVQSGLFRVKLPNPPKDKTRSTRHLLVYLVEERITGQFVKYIHNGSAVPRVQVGNEGDIASFLSFCQHLQYVKTSKQVYISDFQGFNGLLTDPQIMTTPDIPRRLFGDGNVARAFAAFESEHECTQYCMAYGLDTFTDRSGTRSPRVDVVE
ncbi:kinase-like protein [Calocera cornea HHB12733]|uniref:Kinase-like protein n=1 Tax=Calocera cornea HHB12733 TaxID=1353952 RepID=A0A166MQ18_9BASI|nr:kinase-like protein [Calocera cornea HHB12733]